MAFAVASEPPYACMKSATNEDTCTHALCDSVSLQLKAASLIPRSENSFWSFPTWPIETSNTLATTRMRDAAAFLACISRYMTYRAQ